MEQIKKFINGVLFIKMSLWGLFVAGVGFTVLNGISLIGVMSMVGTLILAVDFPKKEARQLRFVRNKRSL